MQKKNLNTSPDETRTFENGKIELANLGDVTIGRAIFQPGWRWELQAETGIRYEKDNELYAIWHSLPIDC